MEKSSCAGWILAGINLVLWLTVAVHGPKGPFPRIPAGIIVLGVLAVYYLLLDEE